MLVIPPRESRAFTEASLVWATKPSVKREVNALREVWCLAENHDHSHDDVNEQGCNCGNVPPCADEHQQDWQQGPPGNGKCCCNTAVVWAILAELIEVADDPMIQNRMNDTMNDGIVDHIMLVM